MKKWLPWLLLTLGVGIVFWNIRWIFVYKFEPEYWENYYYESQWNVPNSKRGISDEGDYRYIGYRLVNGENPFNVDYWVPPLGKYWYGVGSKYLGNPYLISVTIYLLTLLVVGLLARILFEKQWQVWMAVYLFAFNPLIIEQISQTMLDLPMTLFWLVSLLFLYGKWPQNERLRVIGAGIALGLMAGTKPAFFVPMIALVSLGWIGWSNKKQWLYYLPSIVIGYLLAYSCYFIKHPNPIPFIRLHDKIIAFQKHNGGSHDWFNIFRVILTSKYQGFWVGGKSQWITTWSLLLPTGVLTALCVFVGWFKKIKIESVFVGIAIMSLAYIGMNLIIDFWPRYLVPLIPLFAFLVVRWWSKKPILLLLLLVSYIPFIWLTLFPKDTAIKENFSYSLQNDFYRDSYRMLDSSTREHMNEQEWKTASRILDLKRCKTVRELGQWRINCQHL